MYHYRTAHQCVESLNLSALKQRLTSRFDVMQILTHCSLPNRSQDNSFQKVQAYHFGFFHHVNGYILGVLTAYLVKSKIKPKIFDYRSVRLAVWALIYGLIYAVFMYPHYLEENNLKANPYFEMIYPVIGRFVMSLLPCWWFYTASHGYTRRLTCK